MTVAEWADLTPTQRQALLISTAVETDAQCFLLNPDLTRAQDLTTYLDPAQGDVAWDGSKAIHRDCQVTLAAPLAWGVALVQLYQVLTDIPSGLSARRSLGVFCLTAPDQVLGDTVLGDDGSQRTVYSVTGQDRLYLLSRQVGYSYVVSAGTGVLPALQQVFRDAGLTGVLIDSSASASTVPTTMTWPLIASGSVSASDSSQNVDTSSGFLLPTDVTAQGSGPTTWLEIVNDILGLIAYRGVWCDENGFYRCTPYADPSLRGPSFTFDAGDEQTSTVGVSRTVTRDLWAAPNRWIFIWSNMPADGSGNQQTPTFGNGGLYQVDNVTDGPASQTARGLVWPTQISLTAADQASFRAQADARVAADKRVTVTFKVTSAPYPVASHFDVFTYVDPDLDEGRVTVQATSWQIPLNGGDVTWSFETV